MNEWMDVESERDNGRGTTSYMTDSGRIIIRDQQVFNRGGAVWLQDFCMDDPCCPSCSSC